MQIGNIATQFTPVHLVGLGELASEITWCLGQLAQNNHLEGFISPNLATVEVAHPSRFENPGFLGFLPMGARRKDAPLHLKSARIKLEHVEVAKKLGIRVIHVVIKQFRIFPKNPLATRLVSACWAALDLVTQSILALESVGKVNVVEEQHRSCQDQAGRQKWQRQALKANAGRFERNNFIIFGHPPECY